MGYFKQWRRKIGLLTLVMACIFTAGWIRGRFICDIADFGGKGGYQRFNGSCYGLMWFWFEGDPNGTYGESFHYQQHRMGKANGPQPAKFHLGDATQREILWYWHWAGFHFAKSIWNGIGMRITMWVVPYWSIVTPLTLASALLLLSKPQQPKSQMPVQAIQ